MVRKPWFAKKTIWASQASADSGQPCEKTIGCASFGPQSLKKMFVPSLVVMVVMSWFLSVWRRSEEHTSELQSLMRISYAVFCLKNKKIHHNIISNTTSISSNNNIQPT